ncbi:MAG: site-specific tyrosine recombinase/integron integrase [Patescibacteria group bacterium]|mgnify:CR=1 FL=1
MQRFIDDFLEYLEIERNRSAKTLENYRRYLVRFAAFARIAHPNNITQDLVRRYRVFLNRIEDERGQKLKKITQMYHVIALRAFLKFCAKRGITTLAAETVELGKTPERTMEFLDAAEVERLLAAPKTGTVSGLRDAAILETLFSTGTRVSELVALDRAHVNLKTGEFGVLGKGGKLRVVFLSASAQDAIARYLKERTDIHDALFVDHRGRPEKKTASRLTPRSIQRMIKKYAVAAGIVKKVTPHQLRHSFATDLLQGGADIRSVQAMLGHASITTTQVYTHYTDKHLKEVHHRFHRTKNRL